MKKIHIINIGPDGTKVSLKTLKSNQFEDYTLKKLEDFINSKEYFTGGDSIVLDEQTEKSMIIYYAKKNNQINWFIDFKKIKVKNFFIGLNRNEIFFNTVGGYGSTGTIGILAFIFKIIKAVFSLLMNLYKLFKFLSYKKMEQFTGRSKDFIVEVITSDEKWKCGFISFNDFKFKSFVEFFIMTDLGYKKRKGTWIESCK